MCQLIADCSVFFLVLNDAPYDNKEGLVRDLLIEDGCVGVEVFVALLVVYFFGFGLSPGSM